MVKLDERQKILLARLGSPEFEPVLAVLGHLEEEEMRQLVSQVEPVAIYRSQGRLAALHQIRGLIQTASKDV